MAGNPEYTNIQIVVTADEYFFIRIFTAVPAAMSKKVRLPSRWMRGQSTG
jgi:hypothetical protein